MTPQTWLLSGIPRSGTSLCCRLVGELADSVALSEPMQQQMFAGVDAPDEACLRVEEFAHSARSRLLVERRAPSVQVDGRLDDDRVAGRGSMSGLRQPRGGHGEIRVDKPLSNEFTLLIKHNALFAALLRGLASSMACLALVRNPLAVLVSWQTVDLPVHRGRIPAGERYDQELHRALESESDQLRRQIVVLNWFFDNYLAYLKSDHIIRYEDLVENGGKTLFARLTRKDAASVPLQNRNGNRAYAGEDVDALLAALVSDCGAWTAFYSCADCERVADMIGSAG